MEPIDDAEMAKGLAWLQRQQELMRKYGQLSLMETIERLETAEDLLCECAAVTWAANSWEGGGVDSAQAWEKRAKDFIDAGIAKRRAKDTAT